MNEVIWVPPKKIRAVVIGVFKNSNSQYLFMEGHDRSLNEYYYRPIGGGIDFRETAEAALHREVDEEISKKIRIVEKLFVTENLYELEGQPGHEILFAYNCEFENSKDYEFESLEIKEPTGGKNRAVWKSLEEVKSEKRPIYPELLREHL